jgi:hypothetical protein
LPALIVIGAAWVGATPAAASVAPASTVAMIQPETTRDVISIERAAAGACVRLRLQVDYYNPVGDLRCLRID